MNIQDLTPDLPDDNGWRPIASAPKDRAILVWNNYFGAYRSAHAYYWFKGDGTGKRSLGPDGAWPMYGGDDMAGVWFPYATHWQELPSKPKSAEPTPFHPDSK